MSKKKGWRRTTLFFSSSYKLKLHITLILVINMYFTELVMSNIISFTGSRKPVEDTIICGVYVILNVDILMLHQTHKLGLTLQKFKVTQRNGNYVMVYENDECKGNSYEVSVIDGIETIMFGTAKWRWIKPVHKLDSLFNKKEWTEFTLIEKCKRYDQEVNQETNHWWLRYV